MMGLPLGKSDSTRSHRANLPKGSPYWWAGSFFITLAPRNPMCSNGAESHSAKLWRINPQCRLLYIESDPADHRTDAQDKVFYCHSSFCHEWFQFTRSHSSSYLGRVLFSLCCICLSYLFSIVTRFTFFKPRQCFSHFCMPLDFYFDSCMFVPVSYQWDSILPHPSL